MLAAIDSANKSISLVSYIFDNDPSGNQFIGALRRAIEERGVEVRVLVDAAGTRYSFPPITHVLRHAKIPFARFLPSSLLQPWRVATINLRNHRKVLVIDGHIAFTGGMNIRHGNVLASRPKKPRAGPAFSRRRPGRHAPARSVRQRLGVHHRRNSRRQKLVSRVEGIRQCHRPRHHRRADADYDKLRWTLLAALGEAQTSIQILTPYFLPDNALVTALNLAALRGVRVDIILPAKNNLPFVHWASRAMWWQVLERGCHVWLTSPPFDHSKLMIVDGHWVFLGSANWTRAACGSILR